MTKAQCPHFSPWTGAQCEGYKDHPPTDHWDHYSFTGRVKRPDTDNTADFWDERQERKDK